ncbi:MAG: hypothetical protein RL610_94, partial [Pseudomonadota bacterium]
PVDEFPPTCRAHFIRPAQTTPLDFTCQEIYGVDLCEICPLFLFQNAPLNFKITLIYKVNFSVLMALYS